jgi:hypothetical protein
MGAQVSEPASAGTAPVLGNAVVDAAARLVREGNARRITVRRRGESIAVLPLTAGVVGAVLAPALAVVGLLAALLAGCTLRVERARAAARSPHGKAAPVVADELSGD